MPATVADTIAERDGWMPPPCPDLEPPHVPWHWDNTAFWRRSVADASIDADRTARLSSITTSVRAVGGQPAWQGATTGTPYQVVAWSGGGHRVWDLARPIIWRWTGPVLPIETVPLPNLVRREGDPGGAFDRRWIGWDPVAQRLTEICQLNPTANPLLRWIGRVDWTAGWDGAAPGPWTWDTTRRWDAPGQPVGSTATGLPLLPLVARWDEVRRGRIDHALAITLPNCNPSRVGPARGSDGTDPTHPLRGGERLRLPASTVVRWPAGSAARMIAEALAEHGAVVVDRGGIGAIICAQDQRWWTGTAEIVGLGAAPFEIQLSELEVVDA